MPYTHTHTHTRTAHTHNPQTTNCVLRSIWLMLLCFSACLPYACAALRECVLCVCILFYCVALVCTQRRSNCVRLCVLSYTPVYVLYVSACHSFAFIGGSSPHGMGKNIKHKYLSVLSETLWNSIPFTARYVVVSFDSEKSKEADVYVSLKII